MNIETSCLTFKRKPADMVDYSAVLKEAKAKAGNKGKSMLIIHSASLPDDSGAGRIGSNESLKFFDFAKNIWGINEIQLLPIGQLHEHNGIYPLYSGTSMDLGNHIIDIKSYITEDEYKKLKSSSEKIDYTNIINSNSIQEKALRNLYNNMDNKLRKNFESYKSENSLFLEKKGLFRALREINGSYDYKKWNETDKNLFNEDVVTKETREKRIKEIHTLKEKEIDFYKFKQFLAENDLRKAKEKLNAKGLKLDGDMICGFSYDEVWANPKAFKKGKSIGWGLPALDLESAEAEKLSREKVNLYARRFDGFRVDAAWTYVKQPQGKNYGSQILDIIDDEVKKVKGKDFDLRNITHEFAASPLDFNLYNGSVLNPCVKDRVKIFTSDVLHENWGSNNSFLERGWAPDSFIIGATNHDSKPIKMDEGQAEVLSKILKIPKEKLMNTKEFIKAKLAEPMSAFNNMIYIREALGSESDYNTLKISGDYEKKYFDNLEKGVGFNPMDALEKTFKAKGLDKTEPELYRKIVKYRKILEGKKKNRTLAALECFSACAIGIYLVYLICKQNKRHAKSNPAQSSF